MKGSINRWNSITCSKFKSPKYDIRRDPIIRGMCKKYSIQKVKSANAKVRAHLDN